MQIIKSVFAAAVALAAVQAHAAVTPYSFSFADPIPAGTYTAPSFTDGVHASVQSTSVTNQYLEPKGVTGKYLVVSTMGGTAGQATIDAHDAKSYSFVWGSPDTFNTVDIYGLGGTMVEYTGSNLKSQFGIQANGNNNETGLFTITGNDGAVIDHLTLRSTGVAFEVAAAVPEPETYALMLAGLGALGFMARRRNRA